MSSLTKGLRLNVQRICGVIYLRTHYTTKSPLHSKTGFLFLSPCEQKSRSFVCIKFESAHNASFCASLWQRVCGRQLKFNILRLSDNQMAPWTIHHGSWLYILHHEEIDHNISKIWSRHVHPMCFWRSYICSHIQCRDERFTEKLTLFQSHWDTVPKNDWIPGNKMHKRREENFQFTKKFFVSKNWLIAKSTITKIYFIHPKIWASI